MPSLAAREFQPQEDVMNTTTQDFFDRLERELPPLVPRTHIHAITGGLVANKTAANEDNLGTGPAERVRFGLRVAYPKQALIDWLKKKVKDV